MPTAKELDYLENELKHLEGRWLTDINCFQNGKPPNANETHFNQPFITTTFTDNEDVYTRVDPALILEFSKDYRHRLGIYGTWHLLKNAKSICSYVGALDYDGKLVNQFDVLLNHKVRRVVFLRDNLNLFIEFDNQYWLGVFHAKSVTSGFRIWSGNSFHELFNEKYWWAFSSG